MWVIKRLLLFFFLFIFGIGAFSQDERCDAAATDPSQLGVGARSLGLGGALTSLSGESGIFLNPASLGRLDTFHLTSMTSTLLEDINNRVVGGVLQLGPGSLGLGYVTSSVGGFIPTTQDPGQAPVGIGNSDYANTAILVGYGLPVQLNVLGLSEQGTVGGRIKLINQKFSGSVLEGQGGQGMDLDVGVLLDPNAAVTMGMTAHNILPTQWGGKVRWGDGHEESLPALVKTGTAVQLIGHEGLLQQSAQASLTYLLDADFSPLRAAPILFHTGIEYLPVSSLALRAGIDQSWDAAGSGTATVVNNLTLGVGLKLSGFSFDYAFHRYSDLDAYNSHFFSLSYVGQPNQIRLTEQSIDKASKQEVQTRNQAGPAEVIEEIRTVPVLAKEPPVSVVTSATVSWFKDVPEHFWASRAIDQVTKAGLMEGYPEGMFRKGRTVTRADLAILLARLKHLDMTVKGTSKPAKDVTENHPAYGAIQAVMKHNWMGLYDDGKFRPDREIKREEFIASLALAQGMKVAKLETISFEDVAKDHWAASLIEQASHAGWLDDFSGDRFAPKSLVTRADVAAVLSRMLESTYYAFDD